MPSYLRRDWRAATSPWCAGQIRVRPVSRRLGNSVACRNAGHLLLWALRDAAPRMLDDLRQRADAASTNMSLSLFALLYVRQAFANKAEVGVLLSAVD